MFYQSPAHSSKGKKISRRGLGIGPRALGCSPHPYMKNISVSHMPLPDIHCHS